MAFYEKDFGSAAPEQGTDSPATPTDAICSTQTCPRVLVQPHPAACPAAFLHHPSCLLVRLLKQKPISSSKTQIPCINALWGWVLL